MCFHWSGSLHHPHVAAVRRVRPVRHVERAEALPAGVACGSGPGAVRVGDADVLLHVEAVHEPEQ